MLSMVEYVHERMHTYDNLEILIIDSSTDPSVEKILKNYSEKIKVIKQYK